MCTRFFFLIKSLSTRLRDDLLSDLLYVVLNYFTTAQQNVILTSTLPDDLIVLPEQELVFTCVARGARILQWSSDQYISNIGHNIQIRNNSSGMDVTRGSARAILVNATEENGMPVLVSELRITTSTQHPVATIQCDDNGNGSKDNITFGKFTDRSVVCSASAPMLFIVK